MSLYPVEQLTHSTIRIECELGDGKTSTGTGFFYSINRTETRHVQVIVTNKHLIDGAITGRFFLTLKNSDGLPAIGNYQGFEITDFEAQWKLHPDPEVDLCMMSIGPLLEIAAKQKKPFFIMSLDKSFIPSAEDIEDLAGLEKVTMVGYPNGLWDKANNMPIFRQGILATDYKYNWNGKKEFLIDAACFPGSSGSPVMLFDLGGYHSKKGNVIGSHRIRLLGILYAGPQLTVEGDVKIVTVPTQKKAITSANIPINLGVIIKSEQLLAFEGM